MRRPNLFASSALLLSIVAAGWSSGIIPAIIPAAVPSANKIGNSTKFQLAGTVSGTGATICTDASQNTTTTGCTTAAGTVNSGTEGQIGYYATSGTAISGASGMTTSGVVLYKGTGTPVSTTAGTSGQVFTSNGAGVDPTFQAASAGGALILLEQHTASTSATLDFTTSITSTYDDYWLRITNLIMATDNVDVLLQMSTDGGANYDAGNVYRWANWGWTNLPASGVSGGQDVAAITLMNGAGNSSGTYGASGNFTLVNPLSAALYKQVYGSVGYFNAGNAKLEGLSMASVYTSVTAVNAFRIKASSGNITSGVVRVYGVAK